MISYGEFRRSATEVQLDGWNAAISAVIRQYGTISATDWNNLENLLLRMALDIATLDQNTLPQMDGVNDLALSIYSRLLGNTARDTEYQTGYLASLSAACFAAAGNFPTAKVFAKLALEKRENPGEFEKWLVTMLSRDSLTMVSEDTPAWLLPYARVQRRSLFQGDQAVFHSARVTYEEILGNVSESLTGSDSLLALISRLTQGRPERRPCRLLGVRHIHAA